MKIGDTVEVRRITRKNKDTPRIGIVHNLKIGKSYDDVDTLTVKFGEQSYLHLVDDAEAKDAWRLLHRTAEYTVSVTGGSEEPKSGESLT